MVKQTETSGFSSSLHGLVISPGPLSEEMSGDRASSKETDRVLANTSGSEAVRSPSGHVHYTRAAKHQQQHWLCWSEMQHCTCKCYQASMVWQWSQLSGAQGAGWGVQGRCVCVWGVQGRCVCVCGGGGRRVGAVFIKA